MPPRIDMPPLIVTGRAFPRDVMAPRDRAWAGYTIPRAGEFARQGTFGSRRTDLYARADWSQRSRTIGGSGSSGFTSFAPRTGGPRKGNLFSVRVGEPWGPGANNLLARKFNLQITTQGTLYDRIRKSDVLVFTGHHWVRHGLPAGSFHPKNQRTGLPIQTRGINLTKVMRGKVGGINLDFIAERPRLVLVSGCYTLTPKSAAFFKERFPRALVLGWYGSAEPWKGSFFVDFLKRLPDNVNLKDGLGTVISKWKRNVEAYYPRTTRKPGYLTPSGKVFVWHRGTWRR